MSEQPQPSLEEPMIRQHDVASSEHQIGKDLANAWHDHVAENPELTSGVEPVVYNGEDSAISARVEAQTDSRAASLLRLANDSTAAAHRMLDSEATPHFDWLMSSEAGKAYEIVTGKRLEGFRAPLAETIVDVEKDRHNSQEQIFKLLWLSGRKGGLSETELKLLDGWKERRTDLSGDYKADLYDQLRIPFNELPEDQAIEKFDRAVERNQARERLVRRDQAKEDGISHMPSTDHLIERMIPQVGAGRHVLMMGMPGIAKSRVAMFLAKKSNEFAGKPDQQVFEVSIKPDTPTGDIIGRWHLRNGESVYEEGPVMRALAADAPVSVEEFNNADHDVQSVLQRIMLLKVGEEFVVQQGDGRKTYTRGQNFCIIASANPNTKATNRFKLDSAMRERFTGGIFESQYPDSEVKLGDDLMEMPEFAEALLVDKDTLKRKLPNKQWHDADIDKLVKVANWSQYLATHPGDTLAADSRELEGVLGARDFATQNYPLSEIVLSPRQLEDCVRRAQADPTLSLLDALVQFANAPDFRGLKNEQRTFANMLVQHSVTDAAKAAELFRYKS